MALEDLPHLLSFDFDNFLPSLFLARGLVLTAILRRLLLYLYSRLFRDLSNGVLGLLSGNQDDGTWLSQQMHCIAC